MTVEPMLTPMSVRKIQEKAKAEIMAHEMSPERRQYIKAKELYSEMTKEQQVEFQKVKSELIPIEEQTELMEQIIVGGKVMETGFDFKAFYDKNRMLCNIGIGILAFLLIRRR